MKTMNNTTYKTSTKRIIKKLLVFLAKLRKIIIKVIKLLDSRINIKSTRSLNRNSVPSGLYSINSSAIYSTKRFFSTSSRVLLTNVGSNHIYHDNKLKKISTIYIKYLELLMDTKELNNLGKLSLLDKINNLDLIPDQKYIILIKR